MADFARILEEELEEAVEVKNRKSLHRYITLLTENITGKEGNRMEHTEFQQELIKIDGRFNQMITEVREGFKRMDQRFEAMQIQTKQRFEAVDQRFEAVDQRFEAVDKKFESVQQQMDRRFVSMERHFDKRFSMMFSFITIGFVVIATMMSVFQFLG